LEETIKIPKVIHYCWFGKKRKPKLVRDCIVSWKKHLSDYQIIEWNETNSDLSIPFVANAYKQKKWAFVSDYIRLKVIYENGGVYLDTDMMVIKNFDEMLNHNFFLGAEDSEFINCSILGAVKGNEIVKEILTFYDNLKFDKVSYFDITIPRIVTKFVREKFSFKDKFNEIVSFESLVVYPKKYFYPFPFENKSELDNYAKFIDDESYAVHLWSSSWIEYSEFHYFRNKQYYKGLKKMLKEISKGDKMNFKYWRKILSSIKESLN
jgi:mannosyltransferase OCH1-like enzyme